MKTKYILFLLVAIIFYSCNNDEEPAAAKEGFTVAFNSKLGVSITESGREQESLPSLYSMSLFLSSSSCDEVESQTIDIDGEDTGTFIIPSLASGSYSYVVYGFGERGIIHGFGEVFNIESDTIMNASLKNYQTRFKVADVSNFGNSVVHSVEYILKYSGSLSHGFRPCSSHYQSWRSNSGDTHDFKVFAENSFSMTLFEYFYPSYLETFQIKFFDSEGLLLKNNIIDMENKFLDHETSYIFNVDLSSEWESTEGSRINVSVEEKTWVEEVVEVN